MKINLRQVRAYPSMGRGSHCSNGLRLFAQRHQLDWNAFIADGIDEEVLLATGDAMVIAVVNWVKEVYGQ